MSSSSAQLSGAGIATFARLMLLLAKLTDVTKIVEALGADLEKISLLPQQRDGLLEKLKVYGRDPSNSDPIFTKEGIEILARHAFNSPSKTTSRNALRCLANALLLKPHTRQVFVDLGFEAKACSQLKEGNADDEFLISRIIFLTTYDTKLDIESLIVKHHLADIISKRISNHAKQFSAKNKEMDPMEDMALVESLKLLFNLTHFYPDGAKHFAQAVPHILTILQKQVIIPSKALDPPIAQLVNSLINLPLEDSSNLTAMFPKPNSHVHVEQFVEILQHSIGVYKDDELEQLVSPLLTLIRKVYSIAPPEVCQFMQTRILPSEKDREQPVGRGESLSARLLQLSTNPATPQLRESISAMFYELSGKDAATFVQNVGYGFASGFLFQHNLPIPQNAFDAWSTGDGQKEKGKSTQENAKAVNPITGQLLENEAKVDMPEMTQEEKEREAEKLFVLFERLKKNGIISAKNPMEEALQQGRFEELDDDDESD
ncbi:guanine nucleotide exchange factor synembryn protein [Rutstroemia sp. NJR-2017a WRK4]|nr:guanine nucleotide exchange factor synembryn protein [Rutstroemia sp. NJR-2017a WRK4]